MDIVTKIIEYETGELDSNGMLDLFAELIKTGQAWKLQGHYGRTAHGLIENKWISPQGEILKRPEDEED